MTIKWLKRPLICFMHSLTQPQVALSNPLAKYLYIQIQTFDNQSPFFHLAIRQRSEDFKHLSGTGPTKIQVQHTYIDHLNTRLLVQYLGHVIRTEPSAQWIDYNTQKNILSFENAKYYSCFNFKRLIRTTHFLLLLELV